MGRCPPLYIYPLDTPIAYRTAHPEFWKFSPANPISIRSVPRSAEDDPCYCIAPTSLIKRCMQLLIGQSKQSPSPGVGRAKEESVQVKKAASEAEPTPIGECIPYLYVRV